MITATQASKQSNDSMTSASMKLKVSIDNAIQAASNSGKKRVWESSGVPLLPADKQALKDAGFKVKEEVGYEGWFWNLRPWRWCYTITW